MVHSPDNGVPYNKGVLSLLSGRFTVKSTWFRTALVLALLVHLPATRASEEGSVPWTAKPDPLPWKLEKPAEGKSFALGKTGTVVFPTSPSPFACIVQPGVKGAPADLKIIDLRKFDQVGRTLNIPGVDARHLHVSPWGEAIAVVDPKADRPTVQVCFVEGDKPVQSIVIHDTKLAIEGLDFAGRGQILTVKEIRNVKMNLFRRLYEVWDIGTGKLVTSIKFELEYDVRWVGFSAGRKYLAAELSNNDGYFFYLWDLTTGKLAGKMDVQPKKDGFGIAAGWTFSPDGKEAALLWRQGGEGVHAKIHRFDIEKGVKKGQHVLKDEIKPSAPGFGAGGMKSFQFLPDGRGWLVSGHQIVERESGQVVWKVGAAPGYLKNTADRRFVDPYHVTTVGDKKFGDHKLELIKLPPEFDAAMQKASPR